jgi:rubredoxin
MMTGDGQEGGSVPDITPGRFNDLPESLSCPECPIADVIERKEKEARTAAWAGILVAVMGVLSWNEWGFLMGGIGAIGFGLYARAFAPQQAMAAFVAGAMALGVLAMRYAGLL